MKGITFISRYQNLHMDRAVPNSMKTVSITFNSNLASSATPRLLYQYDHDLGYVPQFWGLWDIKYPNNTFNGITKRGYGNISHNTGAGLVFTFFYIVTSTSIKLYCVYNTTATNAGTSGTKATFTGYLFSNGSNAQDYTT